MSEWIFTPPPPKVPRPVPLPAYPPDNHLPGFGGDNAPIGAPPTATDQATRADQRLHGLWAQHGYYGAKPGHQRAA